MDLMQSLAAQLLSKSNVNTSERLLNQSCICRRHVLNINCPESADHGQEDQNVGKHRES
jgi:hypothetical protein